MMAKVRTPTIFTTPQDAATAFYRAFEAKDIDAMMAAWAEDEDIVCVHPGGPRLVGFDAVRVGWEQIFAGETKLLFRLEELVVLETVGMALQSAIEQVTVGNDPAPRGTAIASNVFLRTPSGWRIVLHHASPAPTMTIASPARPLH
jgi:ketosteroid isomerase-like protein